MSEITLEWFFQIPGLFITIGVLLILIALLVLIIGSSKAKNKKQEDLALVDDVQEAAVNQVEPVNVLEPNRINHLNGNSDLDPMNNNSLDKGLNNNNNFGVMDSTMINESASVGNSDNITPTVNNSSNVITPLNVNNSVVTPVDNFANVESIEKVNEGVNPPQFEPIIPAMAQPIGMDNSISNDNLTIQEPAFEPIEVVIKDNPMVSPSEPTTLVQNVNSEIKQESTVAPIFAEPIVPIDNVGVQPVQEEVKTNNVVSESVNDSDSSGTMTVNNNVNDIIPPIVEPIITNSNIVGTELIEPIEPVKQKDLVMGNVKMETPVAPNTNNTVNPTSTVENSEVEEIL